MNVQYFPSSTNRVVKNPSDLYECLAFATAILCSDARVSHYFFRLAATSEEYASIFLVGVAEA